MGTNWWISVVRTLVVPLFFGLWTQHWVLFAFDDPGFLIRSTIVTVAAALYYLTARLLQQRWPLTGFLLLVAAEPYYVDDDGRIDETDRLLISVQRTAVPLAVGWIVAQCSLWVISVAQPVGLVVQCVAAALFYGALRLVEEHSFVGTRKRTVAGYLLGSPTAPVY